MATRERKRSTLLWFLWGFIALQAVVVGVFVLSGLTSNEPQPGYRLRAETMLPTELSVRPDTLSCPTGQALSPVDYLDAGALAKSLPVYDGDLIAVRILLVATEAPDGEIAFAASWPASVVGDRQPSCVFVVGDGSNPADVSWGEASGLGTRFSVANALAGTPTEIEIWLTANDPIQGATFQTVLIPEDRGDDVVLDPLGGRVDIDRRPGSTPTLDVRAGPLDAETGLFEVTATVGNDSPRTRSLDVLLRLDGPGNPAWTLTDQPSSIDCRVGSTVECSLGDLADDAEVVVTAQMQLAPGWAPLAVVCDGPPSDVGFGVCVEAEVLSESAGPDATRQASALVSLPRPPADELAIRTDPPEVVARSGRPVEFTFAVSTAGSNDLGSVTIVGSDCLAVSRDSQPLEDGDAFIEAGETWLYPCELELEDSTSFRFDLAATDGDGQTVSASYEGNVRLIDPEFELTTVAGTDVPTIEVANVGTGTIRDVAVLLPACDSVLLVDGDPLVVAEQEAVRFACAADGGSVEGAVVYGIDDLDFAVVGTIR